MALIEINKNPSKNELRRFALIWFPLFFVVVATLVFHKTHSWRNAALILGPALILSVISYIWLGIAKTIYISWMYASYPIGWVVSHILLGLIYFVVLTPIGVIMKLFGHDPLQRSFQPEASSYWVARDANNDPARYLRQF